MVPTVACISSLTACADAPHPALATCSDPDSLLVCRNLMHNNVAFGTTSNAATGPGSTLPSGAAAAPDAAASPPETMQAASAAQPADAQWQAARAARERFERAQQPGAVEHSEPGLPDSGPPGQPPAGPSVSSMSDDKPDSNVESASLQPARAQALKDTPAAPATERTKATNGAAQAQDGAVSEPSSLSKPPDLPAGGAKRTTQDAAAAARERYLARKRKAPNDAAVS